MISWERQITPKQNPMTGSPSHDKTTIRLRSAHIFCAMMIILSITPYVFSAEINIDPASGHKAISPYIYGKNNCLSDDPAHPLSAAEWQFLREAGIKMFRENGGNNCSKYNWRLKLSSHPDWYNNVYAHDWDYAAQSLEQNMSGVRGMWAFQLIGKVAATAAYNFNDWAYNGSQWWEGVHNNWAGGGGPVQGDGNPDLYLLVWPADSTVAILENWFNELGLNSDIFPYWNMDNEPEIWSSTHDDVYPVQPSAENFMQTYFAVAKKARAIFPGIKLVGPVVANEWQWYNWNNDKINYKNKSYTWLEYFILRIAEEQTASGIRLLDILDLHFYPSESAAEDIVQLHRVWFDKTYDYPGANGVKRCGTGSWDNSITKEYIFERCREWLIDHMGADHGVQFAVTEIGIAGDNPNVTAVWYASNLGVFADNGVEVFTPWTWKTGMWEVLHLFSNYCQETRVASTSDDEQYVSAFSSINSAGDSLTVVLVNRAISTSKDANINLSNFDIMNGSYPYSRLNNLPGTETFISNQDNALQDGFVNIVNHASCVSLPPLSITAFLFTGQVAPSTVAEIAPRTKFSLEVYPNPFNPVMTIAYNLPATMNVKIEVFDLAGQRIKTIQDAAMIKGFHSCRFDGSSLPNGIYFIRINAGFTTLSKKVILLK